MRREALALAGASLLYLAAALPGPWGAGEFDLPGAWRVRRFAFGDDDALRARHREARLGLFARDTSPRADVLLIGSSTIERLRTGALWPGSPVKGRGIGDEPLADMVERLPATLERVRPKVAVIYPASVDRRRPTAGDGGMREIPELVAELREALEEALHLHPELEFVLVQPLPETHPDPGLHGDLARLGADYLRLSQTLPRVTYIPTHRPPLVDPQTGLLDRDHAADRIHLNQKGCEVFSGWVGDVPVVRRFLR